MRLIDGDALIAWIKESQHQTSKMRNVICKIESMPSADRPQGEWIPSDTDGFVCSVCKNGYRNQPTLMGRPMFEYCPVCGARMKGADDE